MNPLMRAALTALVLLPAPCLQTALAQEPEGQTPVQNARPLTLPTLRPAIADTGIFSPLPLRQGTPIRQADGSPGPAYWQQEVDYLIRVTLDTAAHRIQGTASIRYTNHSPDTLAFVWLQLDQNLFRTGSTGSLLLDPGHEWGGDAFEGGFEIDSVVQCSRPADARDDRASTRQRRRARRTAAAPPCSPTALRTRTDETMMYVDLATPSLPGSTTALEVTYAFNIPVNGADRMGYQGGLYQIAQWYPRMAVYDDVHGWNTVQYLGQGEFYLEYGTIAYEVTVPAGYIVAGTGVLQNPADVLTPVQRRRLSAALKSDTTVHIVTQAELASGSARPTQQGSLTWRFRAEKVRDAAWAASPEYLWDALGWQGILAQAFYRPPAMEIWKEAASMSRHSIEEYSTRWFSYPYPQISAVEGTVSAAAYPMLAMEGHGSDGPSLFKVLTHEIGHMWFPMIVGSDERRHAWMDEGLDTFINTFSEEAYWNRDDTAARARQRQSIVAQDQMPTAQPVLTPTDRYRPDNLQTLAYIKPSIMLLTLRDKVLGPASFDSALREYVRRWRFKHPQPADFFRTIEDVSGRDLAWFWRGFFYTTAALDQAVEAVKQEPDGSAQLTLVNLGDAVMPVELELGFEDGTTGLVKLPVEIWYGGNRYVYRVDSVKTITSARVNPDGTFPDAIATNDAWKRGPTKATP
jgi:hypothetical protein